MAEASSPREPSLGQALLPIGVLVALLVSAVVLFGDGAVSGGSQIALLTAAATAALLCLRLGHDWDSIEAAIVHGVGLATRAMFILLMVGALIGTWIQAGIVPTMIVYGLELLHPSVFYPAACLICAIVGLAIGSSWTVAGTLGVALIGVAAGLGLSPAITAGAIISGAYFGDKMSPLSDTTNLAPAAAGSELFAHIRHMTWTTAPAFALALVGFTVLSLGGHGSSDGGAGVSGLAAGIAGQFRIGWYLLLPVLAVLLLAMKRMPALPTIAIGALLGTLTALLCQPEAVARTAPEGLTGIAGTSAGLWKAWFAGYASASGDAAVDELLSRGGMASMLNTIWLVLCAMSFGAVMEHGGLLARLARSLLAAAKSTGALMLATLGSAVGANLVTADQYISIVLPGRVFRPEYERRGLDAVNLSRTLEDGGTISSPLVPWNTCGAFMAATLGVATLDYLPYALFNLLNLVIAAGFAWFGIRILQARPQPA